MSWLAVSLWGGWFTWNAAYLYSDCLREERADRSAA